MLIRHWMTSKPIVIEPHASLAEAKQKMETGHFRRLPVVEGGRLIGMLSDRDLRQHAGHLEHTRVNATMTTSVVVAKPEMLLDQAAALLIKHKIGGLPVVDRGELIGIITATDMLRAFGQVLNGNEEGVSRIDLAFNDSSFDLAMIAELVAQESGELLGMGAYDGAEGDSESRVIYVRVRAEDARRIANRLTENDFSVLAIHS